MYNYFFYLFFSDIRIYFESSSIYLGIRIIHSSSSELNHIKIYRGIIRHVNQNLTQTKTDINQPETELKHWHVFKTLLSERSISNKNNPNQPNDSNAQTCSKLQGQLNTIYISVFFQLRGGICNCKLHHEDQMLNRVLPTITRLNQPSPI